MLGVHACELAQKRSGKPGSSGVSTHRHQQNFLTHPQFATGSQKHRDPKFAPYAFTEHGAIMAATVLNSPRAVEMSIYVVRAFVQLRELLASNTELARRLDELEARIEKKLVGHDDAIAAMLSAIRLLMKPASATQRGIGFTADLSEPKKIRR